MYIDKNVLRCKSNPSISLTCQEKYTLDSDSLDCIGDLNTLAARHPYPYSAVIARSANQYNICLRQPRGHFYCLCCVRVLIALVIVQWVVVLYFILAAIVQRALTSQYESRMRSASSCQ